MTAATASTMISNDRGTRANVLAELKWDVRVDESTIDVQVSDGIVTLEGTANSYAGKLAARKAAHRVAGVLDVVDRIEVHVPKEWHRIDEDIAKAVRAALRWDVFVADELISTTVSDGIVTLQGKVEKWSQRYDAEHLVQHLTGVRGVLNQIAVTPELASPTAIKLDIERALERRAKRHSKHINVFVVDGVVTLTGTVPSWSDKNVIERVAGHARGVCRIHDLTTVDPCC